jgi:hypothetical protein
LGGGEFSIVRALAARAKAAPIHRGTHSKTLRAHSTDKSVGYYRSPSRTWRLSCRLKIPFSPACFWYNSGTKMTAAAKEKRAVTLPEGVSLRRVAQVLLDAWEADPSRWMNQPLVVGKVLPGAGALARAGRLRPGAGRPKRVEKNNFRMQRAR